MKVSYLEMLKDYPQDTEWARDWSKITEVFDTIDYLEELFISFEVTYLRELQQQMLILNLKKYAWSLQGLILEKYSDKRME